MEYDADALGGDPRFTPRDDTQDETQRGNAMQPEESWIRKENWVTLAGGDEHAEIEIRTNKPGGNPRYPVFAVYMPTDELARWKTGEAELYVNVLEKCKISVYDIEWYDVGEQNEGELRETRSLITAQLLQEMVHKWGPRFRRHYLSIGVVKTTTPRVAVELKGIVAAGIGGSKYAAHVAVKLGLKYSLERARA